MGIDTVRGVPPLAFDQVSAGYQIGRPILKDVVLEVAQGEICAVLGPNGAGKSTLIRVLAGLTRPDAGQVRLLGSDVGQLTRREIAQRVAVVPQSSTMPVGFSVREVVLMARAPHQGWRMQPSGDDQAIVDEALRSCSLDPEREAATLSGGEKRRISLACALAQRAPILALDEAASYLDVRHSIELHEVLVREVRLRNLTCVMVMHDLNLASQFADRVVLLAQGRIQADGPVTDVMTYARLKALFDTELFVGVNELDGTRYFLPVRSGRVR